MKLSQRSLSSQVGMIAVLLVVGIGVLGWLVVWPEYSNLKDTQDRGTQLAQTVEVKNKTVKDVDTLISQYNANKADLSALARAVPSAPQVPQILATVENLVKQSGMTRVTNLTITEESDGASNPAVDKKPAPADTAGTGAAPALVTLKVALTVAGTYDALPLLFDLLEKNLRLFEIQIITSQSTGQSGLQAFSITFNTFYQQ
jgi:cytoskeletal protein RodZ